MHQWKQMTFETASPQGRMGIQVLVYRGLALECVTDDAGDVWFDDWNVTHIASGLRIGTISGLDEEEAFKLATVIADVTDWTATGVAETIDGDDDLAAHLALLSDLAGGTFYVADLGGPAPRSSSH